MKLVVLSGKGGTGKTTVAVSISDLVEDVVMVDCDVDAANMHLYYDREVIEEKDYIGNKIAFVDKDLCTDCGVCNPYCKFDSIDSGNINTLTCEGCGVCKLVCPEDAIELKEIKNAQMKVIKTDKGIITKADVEIGSEGSGKLITALKTMADEYNKENSLTVIDGSPGVGCPVIASITGADQALLVIEPTKSGLSDFLRVKELCDHFGMPIMVCINKYDINTDISREIENYCEDEEVEVVGKIPYDALVVKSVNELVPIVKYDKSPAGREIKKMWKIIKIKLNMEE